MSIALVTKEAHAALAAPAEVDMLDLDAIKAAGLNSDEHSRRLLAAHEARETLQLQRELLEGEG